MGPKVAATGCLQWSQPILPHTPSTSQTLASAISSPSWKGRSSRGGGTAAALTCRFVHQRFNRSSLFGNQSEKLQKSPSCELWTSTIPSRAIPPLRACSSSPEAFSDEDFSKKIQELALKFQLLEDVVDDKMMAVKNEFDSQPEVVEDSGHHKGVHTSAVIEGDSSSRFEVDFAQPPWHEIDPESSIERKASSNDLPLSLRIIKKKMLWKESINEARDSAYCSVKKAFSSMVFMIRELQSFTLQMRELLYYEDLQGILGRVHKEMHASFVWLFQQVFSHTPTLMVYVMILLANFTVHSMGTNAAIAAASPPPGSFSATTEMFSVVDIRDQSHQNFDSSLTKTFFVSSSSSGSKTSSIGGNNGGGGNVPPVTSGMDSDGLFDGSNQFRTVVPDGATQFSSSGSSTKEAGSVDSVSRVDSDEEDLIAWKSVVKEAERMVSLFKDETLDHETMLRFVSPVEAKIEPDDYDEYSKTELVYQRGLIKEPNNPLLLANYAQFLSIITRDYDSAEKYFKRAIGVKPADAEAYSKYANFLWTVRSDLWAAEETFLEAIAADPNNAYYSANYAHFLWNTGGEDTCFPLDSPETSQDV